jgi:ribosome-associated protein
MKTDLFIQNGIVIPAHELEITTSRSSGPGGQYVNKTDTKITVRWNVKHTSALTEEQKARVLQNLHSSLTADGDLIVHDSESRSQFQNKQKALAHLAQKVRKALYVPKKRLATVISKSKKEARFREKKRRGEIKKMRTSFMSDES